MSKDKRYEFIKLPKGSKSYGRVKLLEASGYPGVIVEFLNFKFPKKESVDGKLKIKVLKAPKEYKNMDDSHEEKFNNLIKDIFKKILTEAISHAKKQIEDKK